MTVKESAEYGDDVNVLLVEVQGTPPLDTEAFILKQKWMGTRAMWTNEAPFNNGLSGIPACALISPEGEILFSGYTGDIGGKVKDAIAEMLKKKGRGPEGVPAAV